MNVDVKSGQYNGVHRSKWIEQKAGLEVELLDAESHLSN